MNYELMHRDLPVLELDIDEETSTIAGIGSVFAPEHIPMGVLVTDGRPQRASLNGWWLGRAIPASRSGLREALGLLHVSSKNELLLKCFGLSLSDQYWVNSKRKPLDWHEINFFENGFAEDVGNALFGRAPNNGSLSLVSPDNTSDGWLKKKWVVSGTKRLLIKGGSEPAYQEPLNEVLASSILARWGVPHTSYALTWEKGRPLSVCEDFVTPHTDLVSAWHLFKMSKQKGSVSNYQHYLDCCEHFGVPDVACALNWMLALDYLIVNSDRHFNNFGVLRNAVTLEWLGPAPLFDSGTSMWHDSIPRRINAELDARSKPFNTRHSAQVRHIQSFDWLDFAVLDGIEDEYAELLAQSEYIDEERRNVLCHALRTRIAMLERIASRRAARAESLHIV
jgi:hypothetical protein